MPTPIEQAKRQRRELLRRDRALAAALAAYYAESYRTVKALLARFTKEIESARARGAQVDSVWLASRRLWLAHLLAHTKAELDVFADRAVQQIAASQREAVERAHEDTANLLLTAGVAAAIFGVGRVTRPDLGDIAGRASNGATLRSLLERAGSVAASIVHRAVRTGVLGGHDTKRIEAAVTEGLGAELTHALTVARTEHLQAYRESVRRTMIANRHNVFGWLWLAELSPSTCALCWAMHGTMHEPEETLDTHPNCRCMAVPMILGVSERIETGVDLFEQLSEAERREILGERAFEAMKAGKVSLKDFVGEKHGTAWGRTRFVRSLKQILG